MSLLLAAAPLAGACVVCAALCYGLRLKPAPRLPESSQDSTRAVLLPPPTAADIRTWERNLYDWAALRDPTLLVLPNERFGFSRERSARLEVPSAAVPDYEFALPPIEPPVLPALSLCGAIAPLRERLSGAVEPIRPAAVPVLAAEPLPRVTFWRYPDGRMAHGLPGFDAERHRNAWADGPLPRRPTGLSVRRGDRLARLRVVVTEACGNPELDALAVSLLRRYLATLVLTGGLAPAAAPEFLPGVGQEVELQVEWAAPPAEAAAG